MGRFDLVLPHLVDILIKTVSQQSRLDMGVIFGHKRYSAFRLLNKLLSAEVNDVFLHKPFAPFVESFGIKNR